MNSNKLTKIEVEGILFSKYEINIINTVINSIHNDKNTMFLSETFYVGGILVRESIKNGILKELKERDGIDNNIIQSFKINNSIDNITKGNAINKNNDFNFNFKWYNWYNWKEEHYGKKVLINNYEKISFSRIGFDENQLEAIIFFQVEFEKTGYGKMYLLKREIEKWNIIKTIDIHGIIKN